MEYPEKMRWAVKQRMEWIGNRRAPFNRQDLIDKFGISMPQASCDIQAFLKLWPNIWQYNFNKRRYERISK